MPLALLRSLFLQSLQRSIYPHKLALGLTSDAGPICSACGSTTSQRRHRSIFSHPVVERGGKVSIPRQVPGHIERPQYVDNSWVKNTVMFKWIELRGPVTKTQKQIAGVKEACSVARTVLNIAGERVRPGVTTDEIDGVVHRACIDNNAYPSTLLYKGYPKSACTSVNNVACHGIPDDRPLQDGDIVSVDVMVYYKGYHGDVSETFRVGDVDFNTSLLVDMAQVCRNGAIQQCGPGVAFSEIGNCISAVSHAMGFDVIPEFWGHGIGDHFHEPPDICHVENDMEGTMEEGMIFTVEPVLVEGLPDIKVLDDGWTTVTKDGGRSAQFEHTILITANGADILTEA